MARDLAACRLQTVRTSAAARSGRWASSSPSIRRPASWSAPSRPSRPTRSRRSSTTSPRSSRSGRSCRSRDRARYLRRAAEVLVEEIDEVAELLTREQGKPLTESYTMEVVPTIDALHWCAERGPEDPRRRADPHGRRPCSSSQAGQVQLRAARRRRRDRALELPVVDPVRRGRDRADGRQRRRAQAREPDAAARRADPRDVREGRPARGPGARRPRRRRGRPGAVRVVGAEDLLHRLGRGRPQGRRDLRPAAEGLACSSWAARTRRSSAPTPTSRNAISGCVWGGFANAGQTCSGIERIYVVEEVADRFIEGVARASRAS